MCNFIVVTIFNYKMGCNSTLSVESAHRSPQVNFPIPIPDYTFIGYSENPDGTYIGRFKIINPQSLPDHQISGCQQTTVMEVPMEIEPHLLALLKRLYHPETR